MDELPASILNKRWMHSYEEDTPEVNVYRTSDYSFPRSRGRTGFELRDGGRAIYYGIAPTDGTEESPGTWSVEAPGRIRVELENARMEPISLEIVSCDDDRLRVRQT